MQKNFKLTIEYDGAVYHGWQRQKNLPTIQGTIEDALEVMTGQRTTVIGSGRTDAGVHALDQVANFHMATKLTADNIKNGLNSLLAKDIVIKACQRVVDEFHARYDVSSKIYEYVILNRTLPCAINRQYAWHVRKKLELEAMKEACLFLQGRHDFSAFEAAGSPRSNAIRTIMNVSLTEKNKEDYLVFTIEADGFLRCMVRNIVGTLVDVGKGRTSPLQFENILKSKNRGKAGATAPPHGLFLKTVKY